MRTLIINGNVFRNDSRSFAPMDILIEDGKILEIASRGAFSCLDANVIDAKEKRIVSGLVDVHTHGIGGYDFLLADGDALEKMSEVYREHGVTCVMPTLASASFEDMLCAAKRIRDCKIDSFCGVHIEGRYLNPKKRGAHAEELLSELDSSELCEYEKLGLSALHISAAFELDVDKSFVRKALSIGATLGLAHTNATYQEALECERAGISAYTHLYNAMPPLHHRDGGPVAACLLGNAFAELICDGIHISAETVALTYSIKRDKLVLISDSMEATCCSDGEYSIAGNPVTVKDQIARTHDGALAGSTLTLDKAVCNLMRFCNISLEDAIICATEAPAKEIGIFDRCGSIDVSKRADILILGEGDFEIERVFSAHDFF